MTFEKLEKLPYEKKSYGIIRTLVDMIKDGRLSIGDKLPPERELIAQLGVSRSSLREALSALSVVGVLESNQGKRSYIGDYNLSSFLQIVAPLLIRDDKMENDLLDFRRLLEVEALRLIFEKSNRDTDFLRAQTDIMHEALVSKNTDISLKADIAFHKHLFTMSDNFILMQVYDYVQLLMEKSVSFNVAKILNSGDYAKILYQHHVQIRMYIEDGMCESAINFLTKHLDFVKSVS